MSSENSVVRCDTCGRQESVNFSVCLRTGWPKCCKGYTMRLVSTKADIAAAVGDAFAPAAARLRETLPKGA